MKPFIISLLLLICSVSVFAQHQTRTYNSHGVPTTKCKYSKAPAQIESDPDCALCEAEAKQQQEETRRRNQQIQDESMKAYQSKLQKEKERKAAEQMAQKQEEEQRRKATNAEYEKASSPVKDYINNSGQNAGNQDADNPNNASKGGGSTSTPAATGRSAQERYDDLVQQQNAQKRSFDNVSQTITDATTTIWGTAEERKAKTDRQYQEYLDNLKKQEEADEKEEKRIAGLNGEQFKRQSDEWDESQWSKREAAYNTLYKSYPARKEAWLTALKKGTPESLSGFLKTPKVSNSLDFEIYFEKLANEMMLAWEHGKENPDKYFQTAVMGNNWTLVKYLLNAGARPDFSIKTAFGTYYTAIGELLEPYYDIEKELQYTGKDRDTLLRQMIKQGADPNRPSKEHTYAGEVTGHEYIIETIIRNDVTFSTFTWLLENKLLTPQTLQNAFFQLLRSGPSLWYNFNQWRVEKSLEISGFDKNSFTAVDNYYAACAILICKNVPLSGTYKSPYKEESVNLSITAKDYSVFHSLCMVPYSSGKPLFADIKTFVVAQKAMLARVNDVGRAYFQILAKQCILFHNRNDARQLNGKTYDLKPVLEGIINAGMSPKSKELGDFVYGKGWQTFSMISFAKENRSDDQDLINWLSSFK